MKNLFLSILFSLLTLNPLACMSDNKATAEETTSSQDPSDPSAQDLNSVAQQLNKQLEALTKAVQEVDQNSEPNQVTKIQEKLSTLAKISEKLSIVPGKISATFDWLSARLDTILTKKGAIKTALLLGPIVATYCYFFPPEFLKSIVEGTVSATAKGAATISNAAAKGLLSGVGQGLKNNKEELKQLFMENKEEIKTFVNEVAYEAAKIKAGIDLNTKTGELAASWWSNWGTSLLLKVSDGLAYGIVYGIPFFLSTITSAIIKKKFETKT